MAVTMDTHSLASAIAMAPTSDIDTTIVRIDIKREAEAISLCGYIATIEKLVSKLENTRSPSVVVFKGLTAWSEQTSPIVPDLDTFQRWERLLTRINRVPAATIAAIDGRCEGGDFQLALACDFRLATTEAQFAFTEMQQGYLPGSACFRLAKYVGLGVARQLILASQQTSADEAARAGLIDRLNIPQDFESFVDTFAYELLSVDPVPYQLARRLLDESYSDAAADAMGHLLASHDRCIRTALSRTASAATA